MGKNRGFTLIEIAIVLSIIGVVTAATLAVFNPSQIIKRNRDSRRRVDLEVLREALEEYRADEKEYPSDVTWTGDLESYLTSGVPQDPLGFDYNYSLGAGGQTYQLCAHLEIKPDDSVSCAGSCGDNECNYRVTNP